MADNDDYMPQDKVVQNQCIQDNQDSQEKKENQASRKSDIYKRIEEEMETPKDKLSYLQCERYIIFIGLMIVGGYLGAYTYIVRGGVFCNSQTANFMLLSMAIGKGYWSQAMYLLLPMTAYILGVVIAEALPLKVRKTGFVRWDTLLVGVEVLVTLGLGLLPDSVPNQVTQIIVNFICAMQFSTFREAEGIPMATTICTAHIRQIGVYSVKWIRNKDKRCGEIALRHIGMILFFVIGGVISAVLCQIFFGKAIFGASFILLIIFINLFYADLTYERKLLNQKPAGH